MTTTKKDISKIVSRRLKISSRKGSNILESFLNQIKNISRFKVVKLSGFGSFDSQTTPQRIGRNPKTKESYIIDSRIRLTLKVSNIIKESIN
tara:strand:- start:1486 stop:1761 length:276 start_codon:yes stop_codon:yes gene_type:complete